MEDTTSAVRVGDKGDKNEYHLKIDSLFSVPQGKTPKQLAVVGKVAEALLNITKTFQNWGSYEISNCNFSYNSDEVIKGIVDKYLDSKGKPIEEQQDEDLDA